MCCCCFCFYYKKFAVTRSSGQLYPQRNAKVKGNTASESSDLPFRSVFGIRNSQVPRSLKSTVLREGGVIKM